MSNNTKNVYIKNALDAAIFTTLLRQCTKDVVNAFIPLGQFIESGMCIELLDSEGELESEDGLPVVLGTTAFYDVVINTTEEFFALYGI